MVKLLVGYMWLFIHRPFEVWPWLGVLHIERLYIIFTLLFWAFMVEKKFIPSKIHWGVALMAVSIIVTAIASEYVSIGDNGVVSWFKVLVFYVILVTSVKNVNDLKVIVIAFIIILGLYELHSLREYLLGRGVYRMGVWRMVGIDSTYSDPNAFAATICYAVPMIIPLSVIAHKTWHKIALGAFFLLSVTCILLTGSRTGLVGLSLLILMLALYSKYRMRALFIAFIFTSFAMFNISEDLYARYMTIFDSSQGPANAQISANSRVVFLLQAIQIFKENPFFGVGVGGFSIASETGMQSHSLYAQLMSNLGIVGIVSFLVLLFGFFSNVWRSSKLCREKEASLSEEAKFCYRVITATGMGIILLLVMGLAGHNLYRYTWLWFGAFSLLSFHFLKRLARKGELIEK